MENTNEMQLIFDSRSSNESFARVTVAAFMTSLNPTVEEVSDVKTAVSEAVTNAIVHGYGGEEGTVRLHATLYEDDTLRVDVIDAGRGIENIELARTPFFTTCDDDAERSGMGFTVMESFMDDVRVTAGVLMFYIIGIPAFGLRDFFSRVFHSLKDTKTPFRVSCMVVAINVVLNVILRKFMGANGLAFATSIAGYCGMAAMVLLLKKRFGRISTRRTTRELGKIVVSTAVCTAVCVALNRVVPPAEGTLKVTLRLVVCGGASIVAYLACAWALGLNTLKKLVGGRRR